MSDGTTTIEIVRRDDLAPGRYGEVVRLCERAYGADAGIPAFMQQFNDATHVLLTDADGCLLSHALWIERWLTFAKGRVRSAYVELVATAPDCQRRGHASTVMHALAAAITGFNVGALSPSDPAFYTRFGWEQWRGPLLEELRDGTVVPSPAAERVMILRQAGTPTLDLDGPLTAPWRPGEIW